MTRFLHMLLIASALLAGDAGAAEPHARLRSVNAFETPEEVIEYYCARDASGFVWSGMLESERKAFTLWKDPPAHDSFHVARKYQVSPAKYVNSTSTEAVVEVAYELMGTSDAHGTWVPSKYRESRVKFGLRKTNGQWKIHSPLPTAVSPVIVHGRFPYSKPAR